MAKRAGWLLFLLMAATALPVGEAATLNVCREGCGYGSIQEAVDAAVPGDTIRVQSGVYKEAVEVDKAVSLLGVVVGEKGRPTVDGAGFINAITLSAEGVHLEGFQAVGAGGAGIKVVSGKNVIRYNQASDNGWSGIEVRGPGGNMVTGNVLRKCAFGILLIDSRENDVTGNNASYNHDGIALFGSGKNRIRGNVADNNTRAGVMLNMSSGNTLASNAASYNSHGVSLDAASRDNLVYENDLAGNLQTDALDLAGESQWDNGDVGNNYSSVFGCTDRNLDYRCDSPLTIPGGSSIDRYPQVPPSQMRRFDSRYLDNITCPICLADKLMVRN